jgi:ADP-heptose:LPS heptosyltransferase
MIFGRDLRLKPMTEANTNAISRVLIIKLGAFGDVIIAQNKIKLIRNAHPSATLTVLTTAPFAELMRRNPQIDRVIVDRRAHRLKFWHLLRSRNTLRSVDADCVYDLQGSRRMQMYRRWIGRDVPWHVGTRHLSAPGQTDVARVDLEWLAEPVDELLKAYGVAEPFVFLVPGCSARNQYKRWPHFDALARSLASRGYACVTAPGPDEIDTCRGVTATMLMNRGADGRERPLSIPQLAGLAKRACFVVGNDTGPTHLCAFSGRPGLAIFGPFTPASQVGIDRFWPCIEVQDLDALSPVQVLEAVLEHIPDTASA